jgi:AraC family transcriptional activator of mar-sox-rob regulon
MLRELTRVIPEGTVVGDRREVLTVWGIVSLLLASQADAYEEISLKSPRTRHGDRMEAVCVWLNEHLSEEMNLDEMASKFALSRSLLTRSFRQHTGTSIVEYVNARRLEKAAVLLTATADENILHAAIESGFSNLSHFYRRFKAAYGLTPAEFRRNFSN